MSYTGLEGIILETAEGSPYRPVTGLSGIVIEIEGNLPVKVLDKRGHPLSNCEVTIANPTSGVPSVSVTDSLGNCILQADASILNPVTLKKEKASMTVDYTGGSTFLIHFEPPLPY